LTNVKKNTGKLICIVGPTCTGKGRTSVELALLIGGAGAAAIVSCDSAKVYRGMDLGTGKMPMAERRGINWYMLDVAEPTETYSAGRFAKEAAVVVSEVWASGRTPILAGGTGLYFRALVDGICDAPPGDPETRRDLLAKAAAGGDLYAELAIVDPDAAEKLKPGDTKRIVRALEVYLGTGVPLSEHQKVTKPAIGPSELFVFGFDMDRGPLAARIAERTRRIISAGLEDEVRHLLAAGVDPASPALQAIGYRQTVAYIKGKYGTEEWERLVNRDTHRLAKRQRTWWRADERVEWLDAEIGQEKNAGMIFDRVTA
jgi:tRNA dimethylallyltransferase